MISFDPMAVAIDWLEAYRAEDIEALLDLYDEGASLECDCGGQKIMVGREAIRAYWKIRFSDKPHFEFEEFTPVHRGVHFSYRIKSGVVKVLLDYNDVGKIERSRCGPTLAFVDV